MRVGIVLNPRHGRGVRAGYLLGRLLTDRGVRWKTMTTTEQRTGACQARALVEWGARALVVIGGDGTVRAVAPELASAPGSGEGAGTPACGEVPLIVVPTGSATVLARHLGIRSERAALDLVVGAVDGSTTADIAVPVHHADLVDESGRGISGRFLLMAGMGGDAEAVARKLPLPGVAGYVHGAVRALAAPILINPSSTVPGEESRASDSLIGGAGRKVHGTWAVMASTVACPAGPIPVFPEAELGQRGFECLRVRVPASGRGLGRVGAWTRIGAAALIGRPGSAAGMDYWTADRLRVAVGRPARVHLDGDDFGPCTEMTLSAGAEQVRFLVPRRLNRRIGLRSTSPT